MKFALYVTLLMMSLAGTARAQQNWWFDVEVIVFDRGQSVSASEEQFEYADNLATPPAGWDLLGKLLQPDISLLKQSLPHCQHEPAADWPRPLWQAPDALSTVADTPAADPSSLSTGNAQRLSTGNAQYVTPAQAAAWWLEFHGPQPVDIRIPAVKSCQPDTPWLTYANNRWQRHLPDNSLPMPDVLPVIPKGSDAFKGSPQVLSADALQLTKLSEQIRRTRGLTRLLHTAWRQPVAFGQNKAPSVRLFAGQNYASQFQADGRQRQPDPWREDNDLEMQAEGPASADSNRFFDRLDSRLRQAEPLDVAGMLATLSPAATAPADGSSLAPMEGGEPIWQLDGQVRVYLKYINRVPYLHIDSELFYRQPIPLDPEAISDGAEPEYQLVSVPFNQIRRVISKQLHYFDHPLFGMVIEIRRYNIPEGF